MAIGLPPKYTNELSLENLTPEQFLTIAIDAAKKLNWKIGHVSKAGFIAHSEFEEITVRITDGNANLKSKCAENQLFDLGENKKNIKSLVKTITELKSTVTTEELAQKQEALELTNEPLPTTKGMLKKLSAVFVPTKGYFITPLIIDLNIIIFILMVISGVDVFFPDNESLLQWGANFKPVTLAGNWWRLITSCFVHVGIFHLALNMYALYYIGLLLEPYLGKSRFTAAYFLTGITASTVSLWWHDYAISAGASGAIFGMYGVFLSMLITHSIERSARKPLLISIGIFVIINLLLGLQSGFDNAAHIGGLISGIIIGYAYFPSLKKPAAANLKYLTICILTIFIILTSFVIYKKLPNDAVQFDERIQNYATMEQEALKVYSLPENTPRSERLAEIANGRSKWNECITLVTELDKLNLPASIHKRNKKLIDYCNLRIKSYDFMYMALDDNSLASKDSVQVYENKINTLVRDINGK